MAETLTLRWRDDVLSSALTDAEAAAACERIPADHHSHDYTQSLIADLRHFGSLFEGKRFWLHCHAQQQVEREARAASPAAVAIPASATAHLPRIAAFLTPVSRKLKSGARVTFESGPLTVSIARAGERSRHPGSFYVRGLTGFGGDGYFGRITPEGHFLPSASCPYEVLALLDEFEANPAEYCAAYGRRTGNCCFCAARLNDPVSMGLGYGPVCGPKYGLKWGKLALQDMKCAKSAPAA